MNQSRTTGWSSFSAISATGSDPYLSKFFDLGLELRDTLIELAHDRLGRLGCPQIDACPLQKSHRVVASTGPQQIEEPIHALAPLAGTSRGHLLNQLGRGSVAGRILIDVIRRPEEVRHAGPRNPADVVVGH